MSVVKLYEQKRDFLIEMRAITNDIEKSLETQDAETFERLIRNRQNFIDRISSIDSDYPSIAYMPEIKENDKLELDLLKKEIQDIFADIKEHDIKLRTRAEEYLKHLKKHINKIKDSRAAMQQYGKQPSQISGYFVEKKK